MSNDNPAFVFDYGDRNHRSTVYEVKAPKMKRKVVNIQNKDSLLLVMGFLICLLILAIVIVAVILSLQTKDLDKNFKKRIDEMKAEMKIFNQSFLLEAKMMKKNYSDTLDSNKALIKQLNEVNNKYLKLQADQTSTSEELKSFKDSTSTEFNALKESNIYMNKSIEENEKLLGYDYVGFGYGRDSNGKLNNVCFGLKTVFNCLVTCYEHKLKTDPSINGMNYNLPTTKCCCEIATKSHVPDKEYLHYMLYKTKTDL